MALFSFINKFLINLLFNYNYLINTYKWLIETLTESSVRIGIFRLNLTELSDFSR